MQFRVEKDGNGEEPQPIDMDAPFDDDNGGAKGNGNEEPMDEDGKDGKRRTRYQNNHHLTYLQQEVTQGGLVVQRRGRWRKLLELWLHQRTRLHRLGLYQEVAR